MRILQADVIGLHMSSFHAGHLRQHIADEGGAGQFPGKRIGCENFRAEEEPNDLPTVQDSIVRKLKDIAAFRRRTKLTSRRIVYTWGPQPHSEVLQSAEGQRSKV
jgi:hypothetical protein